MKVQTIETFNFRIKDILIIDNFKKRFSQSIWRYDVLYVYQKYKHVSALMGSKDLNRDLDFEKPIP